MALPEPEPNEARRGVVFPGKKFTKITGWPKYEKKLFRCRERVVSELLGGSAKDLRVPQCTTRFEGMQIWHAASVDVEHALCRKVPH